MRESVGHDRGGAREGTVACEEKQRNYRSRKIKRATS